MQGRKADWNCSGSQRSRKCDTLPGLRLLPVASGSQFKLCPAHRQDNGRERKAIVSTFATDWCTIVDQAISVYAQVYCTFTQVKEYSMSCNVIRLHYRLQIQNRRITAAFKILMFHISLHKNVMNLMFTAIFVEAVVSLKVSFCIFTYIHCMSCFTPYCYRWHNGSRWFF